MKRWLFTQIFALKCLGLCLVLFTDYDGLGWFVFFSGGGLIVAHIFLPRAQGLCDVVTGFKAEGKEVWLTIDDGPDADDTPRILDLLQAHGAKATFFMVGERAAAEPDLVAAVRAQGHSVGTHTQTHPTRFFWMASRKRVAWELDESMDALGAAGEPIRLFRSPVGIKNLFLKSALRHRGLDCIAWTIRSKDALSMDPEQVALRVERLLTPGAIILMHEGAHLHTDVRVEAIRRVLERVQAKGYRCVLPERERWEVGTLNVQGPTSNFE